jgi:hypothetical protein
MSKPFWRRMPPKEAAAELFRSCLWQMKEPTDAANKAAYYLFSELMRQLGEDHPRHRELMKQITANPDAPNVGALQTELQLGIIKLGSRRAKHIFQRFGSPLSKRRLQEIASMGIIDRLDIMKGGPNVKELARRIARERYSNPTPQQIETVERQIQKLNRKRNANPFWPQREG